MERLLVLMLVLLLTSCDRSQPASNRTTAPSPEPEARATTGQIEAQRGPVQIEMRNVHLRLGEGIALEVRRLRGEMLVREEGRLVVFDDQQSFTLRIFEADVSMSAKSIEHLMNNHLFAYEGAPFKDLEVTIEKGRLKQKGTLQKGIGLPFETVAEVSATDDGRIRLHATKVKALGIPAKGLMKLLGLELDDIVSIEERAGVHVSDNDVLLSPGKILPPPEMEGQLARVEVSNGTLHQVFKKQPSQRLDPPEPKANYVFFRHGNIRFGKLTMHDADLQLVDADPSDPFDFYPNGYNVQLVAGYSKNLSDKGLKTYMPDYGDVYDQRKRRSDVQLKPDVTGRQKSHATSSARHRARG